MNFFTYKYLEIENYDLMVDEIKSYLDFDQIAEGNKIFTGISVKDLLSNCVLLNNFVKSNNLSVIKAVIVRANPGDGKNKIHIDNCNAKSFEELKINYVPKENEVTRDILGINIGLTNINETYTGFFKYISGEILKLNHLDLKHGFSTKITNFPSLNYSRAEIEEIDRYYATKPVIFNSTVPHGVYNNTDKTRFLLTLRFDPDPWHLTK